MDVFMIIVAAIISIVLLVGLSIVIIYFGHPDDQNTAWLPKLVVLIALYFACANVLLLPFDVANTTINGGLDLKVAWDWQIYITAALLIFVIPFAYFYYENDNDPKKDKPGCCGLIPGWNGQCCEGIKWSVGFLFAFGFVCGIMYYFLRWTDLPVTYSVYNWDSTTLRTDTTVASTVTTVCNELDSAYCVQSDLKIKIEVTFAVFLLAMLAFFGWFLFVVFAGLGLPALPWDLFHAWLHRAKPIPLRQYATEKQKLGQRATILKECGQAIRNDELNTCGRKVPRKERREITETFHKYENAVYLLKRDFFHLEQAYKLRGGNPFWPWVKLLASIIGASMSLAWIAHICVYMIPTTPLHPFLNYLFIQLELPQFSLFGILAFAFYSFWLLVCAIKGNFRFGLRFACCRAFPMEMNNTLLNSFLANSFLILISSLVVVQFCAMAFPVYARNTEIDLLFGVQIRYLRFFTYFFANNVFVYALLVFVVIGATWLLICPRNEAARIEKELRTVMQKKDTISKRDLERASALNG